MINALIPWPESTDYPLFRQTLPQLSEWAKPTICITPQGGTPLMGDILVELTQGGCQVLRSHALSSETYPGDWRNATTNYMIDQTSADWVLFLEQDFFIKDYPHFFHIVKNSMENHDVIMFEEGNRYHPAFLLVKRVVINHVKRDFSAGEQGYDHFAHFSQEIRNLVSPERIVSLQELDLLPQRDWWHMRGLTDNYFAPKPYFNLPEFVAYNEVCLNTSVGRWWFSIMLKAQQQIAGIDPDPAFKEFLCQI
jgi:hypothetical protein